MITQREIKELFFYDMLAYTVIGSMGRMGNMDTMKPDCATCKHHAKYPQGIWCWLYRKLVTVPCGNYDDREPGSEG